MADETPDESVTVAGSSISITREAVTVPLAGIPSLDVFVHHSTAGGNTHSSTQKKRLFQFLRESKGLL
uniref:Uncharacterized protein n=1 Tax=Tanacetum cinerariifolium TaxID=118510 RepID=A0A699WB79_TANCI|nr:hypothetical protein [Tanacetum cinerariifolium]